MKTEVYFAIKDNNMIIAYTNHRKQEVFLSISRYNFAPFWQKTLILDNSRTIEDILNNCLGYEVIKRQTMEIGIKFKNIWKPFIQDNVTQELNFDIPTLYRSKRNLSILIQKLQEILLFVEPTHECLNTYSHKIKELLILACTELENSFKFYEFGNNQRTSDYVNLLNFVDLSKYKISLVGYVNSFKVCPFENWSSKDPTKSLPWYDAYTKLKHNSDKHFALATLNNCINAIVANIVMFVVRYSVRYLYTDNDLFSNLISTSFNFLVEESFDFYIPVLECIPQYTEDYVYVSRPYWFDEKNIANELLGRQTLIPYEEKLLK